MTRRKSDKRRISYSKSYYQAWPTDLRADIVKALAKYSKTNKYVKYGITTDIKAQYALHFEHDYISWQRMYVRYRSDDIRAIKKLIALCEHDENYIDNNNHFPETLFDEYSTYYVYFLVGRRKKNKNSMKQKTIRVGTVFSGIGSPEQALIRLGHPYQVLFACDNGERLIDVDYKSEIEYIKQLPSAKEKREYVDGLYNLKTRQTNYVQQSYLANYKVEDDNFYQDVILLDGTDYQNEVDLFIGGSPCQSFSIAGARGGFEDTRGTLFFEYCRLVKEIQPEVFIYENVYGVLTHDKGRTWETMKNVFGELGYHFSWQILDARDYGIPQGRRRLFVVGFKNEDAFNRFSFPEKIKLEDRPLSTMQDMLEENMAIGSMQSVDGVLTKIDNKKGEPEDRYYLSEKLEKYVLSPGTKNFMHYDAKTDLPIARALVKNMGNTYRASVNNYVHTHGRIRHLTMREVHRLMGYPDSYKIVVSKAQAYKQAGNSIVVDVMMNIEKQIIKAMNW